ncbi:glycoside hydrolase family 25 protein [Ferruginibacter sp. SUN002]|uniref:glycoside hydrolase family 25 protein n=1 Tax=Ferruginibacter sp. SUN002 TaxID=2937789 RepID=UPI003D35D1C9
MLRKVIAAKWLVGFWLLLSAVTGAAYYLYNKPVFVRYPGFGIDIPQNYRVHGIDVSKYQSAIDWTEVKAMKIKNINIDFCFIKATEGTESVDHRFRRNWSLSKENGVIRGAYHFFNPSKSGKEQAANFIKKVTLEKGDLPPVLDIEQINGTSIINLQQSVNDFLMMMEAAYKVKPIIYTNVSFYESYLAGKFDDYPLWVAHYLIKDKPRIGRDWMFWQHNESGHVNGIDAYVDFNVFNGSEIAFRKLLLK